MIPALTYPVAFYLSLPVALFVFWWTWSRQSGEMQRRGLLAGVRAFVLLLLFFYLSGPYFPESRSRPAHRQYLIDISYSQSGDQIVNNLGRVEKDSGKKLTASDRGQLFLFAEGYRQVSTFENGTWNPSLRSLTSNFEKKEENRFARYESVNPYRSVPGRVLSETIGFLPADGSGSQVIFTDGHTGGDDVPSEEREVNLPSSITSYLVPSPAGRPNSVSLTSIEVPGRTYTNEPFQVGVRVKSYVSVKGTLRIALDGEILSETSVELERGESRRIVRGPFHPFKDDDAFRNKLLSVRAELETDGDPFTGDNSVTTGIEFAGPLQVLLVSEEGENSAIRAALDTQGVSVTHRKSVDRSFLEKKLGNTQVVLLDGPDFSAVPEEAVRVLKRYVKDSGGGLLVFGTGEENTRKWLATSNISESLPVRVTERPSVVESGGGSDTAANQNNSRPKDPSEKKSGKREEDKEAQGVDPEKEEGGRVEKGIVSRVALLLVVDKSGSMVGKKIGMVKEAAIAAMETLHDDDYIGVLAFDHRPRWVTPPVKASRKDLFRKRIARLHPGGNTNIYPALKGAYDVLRKIEAGIKHVVLLSDGQTPLAEYKSLSKKMAEKNITISTVSVGEKANTALLNNIAIWGKGSSYETKNFNNIPQIFTSETRALVKESSKKEKKQKEKDSGKEEEQKRPEETLPTAKKQTPDREKKKKRPEEESSSTTGKQGEKKKGIIKIREYVPLLYGFDEGDLPAVSRYLEVTSRPMSIVPLEVTVGEKQGSPFLSYWYTGSGTVGVISTRIRNESASSWVEWEELPRFLAQTVRSFSGTTPGASMHPEFDLTRNTREEGIRISILIPEIKQKLKEVSDNTLSWKYPNQDDWKPVSLQEVTPGHFVTDIRPDVPGKAVFFRLKSEMENGKTHFYYHALSSELPGEFRVSDTRETFLSRFRSGKHSPRRVTEAIPEPSREKESEKKDMTYWPLSMVLLGLVYEIFEFWRTR